ncbi:hypothetical protein [Stutzerimonas kunmingensis]|uniref:hypothetical protein n=1 Tax=Stutzerimonas kunmingensis TaxID=1211807 RepID=UPI0028A821A3|nr:hypothetical protein [Stutzerimonas kunmingensis]
MQTFVSGLSEQASFTALGGASGSLLQWLTAGDFIAQALAAADDEAGGQWLWLYRAPWALLAQGGSQPSAEVLAQWQAQQRAVLQLRRHLRQRLVLVNIDRVASPLLAERFGVPFIEGALPDEKPNTPLLSTLANLFEQKAPECWELYEALEAAAWLPEGEPEFRTNRPLPRAAELTELLDLVRAGKQLAAVSQRLDARETELQQLNEQLSSAHVASETTERQAQQQLIEHQQALQAARTQAEALQQEKQSLTEENELLLNQLHQVQEELEKHYLDGVSLKEKQAALEKELAQSKAAHQQASKELTTASGKATEAEKVRQKLAGELASLQKEKAELQAKAQSDAEENELLLNQLHQVQEELENYYLANREILAVMGQSEQTLHRARGVISRMAAHG